MPETEICCESFLSTRFLDLPWLILENICLLLPATFVYEVLIKVPECREFVNWYAKSQETHLLPGGQTTYHHPCQYEPNSRNLDLLGYDEIRSTFALRLLDLPCRFKVIMSRDIAPTMRVLREFHQYISQASSLDFVLTYCTILSEDVETLFTFQNIRRLHLVAVELDKCTEALERLFPLLQSLREFEGTLQRYPPYLPPKLESLNLNVNELNTNEERWQNSSDSTDADSEADSDTDSDTDSREATEEDLVDTSARRIVPSGFTKMPLPDSLKELKYQGSVVNLSRLPRGLEAISLQTHVFHQDAMGTSWPSSLKSIKIESHEINDVILKRLSSLKWPPSLRSLWLFAWMKSLDGLTNLPDLLDSLYLYRAQIRGLKVKHNIDNYAFFRFPDSLVSLTLDGCYHIVWEKSGAWRKFSLRDRIHFPPLLKYLRLSYCKLRRLAYFVFPSSLQTLILQENKISNLNSYNLRSGKTELVSWKHLVNLKHISMVQNKLRNLKHWCPPKSLRKLDLRKNSIKCLDSKVTPLFQIKYHQTTNEIHHILLSDNRIEEIDSSVSLPRNLLTLDLRNNRLPHFLFFDSLASHDSLYRLDLHNNFITRVSVPHPSFSYGSNLKEISFKQYNKGWFDRLDYDSDYDFDFPMYADDECFQMSAEDFFEVLKLIGLISKGENKVIMRDHRFC